MHPCCVGAVMRDILCNLRCGCPLPRSPGTPDGDLSELASSFVDELFHSLMIGTPVLWGCQVLASNPGAARFDLFPLPRLPGRVLQDLVSKGLHTLELAGLKKLGYAIWAGAQGVVAYLEECVGFRAVASRGGVKSGLSSHDLVFQKVIPFPSCCIQW